MTLEYELEEWSINSDTRMLSDERCRRQSVGFTSLGCESNGALSSI